MGHTVNLAKGYNNTVAQAAKSKERTGELTLRATSPEGMSTSSPIPGTCPVFQLLASPQLPEPPVHSTAALIDKEKARDNTRGRIILFISGVYFEHKNQHLQISRTLQGIAYKVSVGNKLREIMDWEVVKKKRAKHLLFRPNDLVTEY